MTLTWPLSELLIEALEALPKLGEFGIDDGLGGAHRLLPHLRVDLTVSADPGAAIFADHDGIVGANIVGGLQFAAAIGALVPLFALTTVSKSFFSSETDFAAILALACSVASIVFQKGRDAASALSRLMRRISSFATYLERAFADLSVKIDKAFSQEADILSLAGRDDPPIEASRYRNVFPKSIALALCTVLIVGAYVAYVTVSTAPSEGGSSFVIQSVRPTQEVNKAKKMDRTDLATRFEDRFLISPDGCDACGGPELIPVPPRRPHFHPVPRPRPSTAE